MSPPLSELFEVRDIPNAGRGVIACSNILARTVLLESGPPALHVIFRIYSKETCAFCYCWDRGRSLPVRDHPLAKVFCSDECRASWIEEQGRVGVEAWICLATFLRAKGRGSNEDEAMGDGPRPLPSEIDVAWQETERQAKVLRQWRSLKGPQLKSDRKAVQAVLRKIGEAIDPDMLSYLLSGSLFRYKEPSTWHTDLSALASDDQPYKTRCDLERVCNSYAQLVSILPLDLLPSITPELCRLMLQADSHNAFGIRSGDDNEEYMGYGVYPSASYFNHSCNPNLRKARLGRQWNFSAARDIAPGEECCISYLGGDEKDMTRDDRQGRLKNVWGFDCNCERCLNEAAIER